MSIKSPNQENTFELNLNEDGALSYTVMLDDLTFIKTSALGFELKGQSLKNDFLIIDSSKRQAISFIAID